MIEEIEPIDTTSFQKDCLDVAMESFGYKYNYYYQNYQHQYHKAAETISFHTAVMLHNCPWIRVSNYEWVPDFHFFPNSCNKSSFRFTSYDIKRFQASKIIERVHLQKHKNKAILPTTHWVKFVDEDYYATLVDKGIF